MAEYEKVKVDKFVANAWNPNVVDEVKMASLKKRIAEEDPQLMLQPILARRRGKKLEIIDGEHRWTVAKEIGSEEVWALVIEADDDEAKIKTMALNILRGDPDVIKLAKLIADLSKRKDPKEIAMAIGMTENQVLDHIDMGLEDLKLSDIDKNISDSASFRKAAGRTEVYAVELTTEEKDRVLEVLKRFEGETPADRFMALIASVEAVHDENAG
jgi:ParB family chromosome partitioning protein